MLFIFCELEGKSHGQSNFCGKSVHHGASAFLDLSKLDKMQVETSKLAIQPFSQARKAGTLALLTRSL
jgi:hypothetical protein